MNCTNSCPKGLNPAKVIGSIKMLNKLKAYLFNYIMKTIQHFVDGKSSLVSLKEWKSF